MRTEKRKIMVCFARRRHTHNPNAELRSDQLGRACAGVCCDLIYALPDLRAAAHYPPGACEPKGPVTRSLSGHSCTMLAGSWRRRLSQTHLYPSSSGKPLILSSNFPTDAGATGCHITSDGCAKIYGGQRRNLSNSVHPVCRAHLRLASQRMQRKSVHRSPLFRMAVRTSV